jgi:hypothetical protein
LAMARQFHCAEAGLLVAPDLALGT